MLQKLFSAIHIYLAFTIVFKVHFIVVPLLNLIKQHLVLINSFGAVCLRPVENWNKPGIDLYRVFCENLSNFCDWRQHFVSLDVTAFQEYICIFWIGPLLLEKLQSLDCHH